MNNGDLLKKAEAQIAASERRLRAIPVEERSAVVRALIGPWEHPCPTCRGRGVVLSDTTPADAPAGPDEHPIGAEDT